MHAFLPALLLLALAVGLGGPAAPAGGRPASFPGDVEMAMTGAALAR